MFIPEEIIEEVRNRTDLVEIISDYVLLKKSGENYKALCPFHVEKTPSFVVNPRKGIFHCFGCGVGGNVYSFLMKVEKMEFVDAVKHLAARCGVAIPELQSSKQIQEKDTLYKINELASNFYEQLLRSQEGEKALDYLKRRNIADETIKKFKLGYAPDAWDKLLNTLVSKGYSQDKIQEAGLILPREGGGYYDRFRNRIIFPIITPFNRIIGFGARVLDDSLPKYINTPETPIYHKGKILYGLNFAKDAIRKLNTVIIVEGYTDVILLYQAGFENVVATSGTAFTHEQVRLLKRYGEKVFVLFDPDTAGIQATLRGLDLLMEQEMGVKVVTLPENLDPADFLARFGAQQFSKCLQKADDLLDYRFNQCITNANINTTDGKIKALEDIIPTILKISNPIQRQDFIKRIAETLQVNEEIILSELNKGQMKPSISTSEYVTKQEGGLLLAEKGLIKFMLENEVIALQILQEINPEDFSNTQCKDICKVIVDLLMQKKSISPERIIDLVDDKGKDLITSLLLQKDFVIDKEGSIKGYIKKIKENIFNKRKLEVQKAISELKEDDDKLLDLQRQYQELDRQIRNLKSV
ncbi:MAG: DNA primase [bacterium]